MPKRLSTSPGGGPDGPQPFKYNVQKGRSPSEMAARGTPPFKYNVQKGRSPSEMAARRVARRLAVEKAVARSAPALPSTSKLLDYNSDNTIMVPRGGWNNASASISGQETAGDGDNWLYTAKEDKSDLPDLSPLHHVDIVAPASGSACYETTPKQGSALRSRVDGAGAGVSGVEGEVGAEVKTWVTTSPGQVNRREDTEFSPSMKEAINTTKQLFSSLSSIPKWSSVRPVKPVSLTPEQAAKVLYQAAWNSARRGLLQPNAAPALGVIQPTAAPALGVIQPTARTPRTIADSNPFSIATAVTGNGISTGGIGHKFPPALLSPASIIVVSPKPGVLQSDLQAPEEEAIAGATVPRGRGGHTKVTRA